MSAHSGTQLARLEAWASGISELAFTRVAVLLAVPLVWAGLAWFLDGVDKEKAFELLPLPLRRVVLLVIALPTLGWTYIIHRLCPRRRRWWDRVDEVVILGALPLPWQVEKLNKQENVVAIINCTDEFSAGLCCKAAYKLHSIEQLRIPTLDFASPTVEHLEKGLGFIKAHRRSGTVYVHCKAGRGRAATMAAAYLIWAHQLRADEAQARLKKVRPHVSSKLYKRPALLEIERRYGPGAALQDLPPELVGCAEKTRATSGDLLSHHGMDSPRRTATHPVIPADVAANEALIVEDASYIARAAANTGHEEP